MDNTQYTPNRRLVLALRIVIAAQLLTLLLGLALMQMFPGLVLVLTILVILASLLLTLATYALYRAHPLTKAKLSLQKQLGQIGASILATNGNQKAAKRSRDAALFEQEQEIKRTIASLQNAYFAMQLKQQPIDQAKIPGIGPKLKERLAAHRILTAYDVSPDIANLEGFGASKSEALLDWRASVITALEPGKPKNLPSEKRAAIQQSYQGRISKAEADISASTNRLTQLESQRINLETSLAAQQGTTFSQYLQPNLTAVTAGKLSPKIASALTAALLALTTLFQCGQGARSTFAVIASSIPTNTPTFTLTFTPTQTNTLTPTCTSTWTLTPTITRTPTITLTPTITNTPTITLTPTITPTSTRTFTPTPTRTLTPTITRTFVPLPTSTPICNCNIDYDCSNFSTHNQAQACFVYCGGSSTYNWSNLDANNDGIACESLP